MKRYFYRLESCMSSSGMFVVYDGYAGQAIKYFYFKDDAEKLVARLNAQNEAIA